MKSRTLCISAFSAALAAISLQPCAAEPLRMAPAAMRQAYQADLDKQFPTGSNAARMITALGKQGYELIRPNVLMRTRKHMTLICLESVSWSEDTDGALTAVEGQQRCMS